MRIKCNGCGRILENPYWNEKDTCKNCGNYFSQVTPRFPMQNDIPSIPHIYLGKDGFSMNNPIPKRNNQMYPPRNNNLPPIRTQEQIKEEKTYEFYEKIRKYGFYILLFLVIGYAAYRIIKLFIG